MEAHIRLYFSIESRLDYHSSTSVGILFEMVSEGSLRVGIDCTTLVEAVDRAKPATHVVSGQRHWRFHYGLYICVICPQALFLTEKDKKKIRSFICIDNSRLVNRHKAS
ncbi:hypothetical protein Plhal304r1_c046g0127831 [Plasmopara halstedii]